MEHLRRKFKDRYPHISERMQKDRFFEEICFDYEEISTWLNSCDRWQKPSEVELSHARDLVAELEEDIRKLLERENKK